MRDQGKFYLDLNQMQPLIERWEREAKEREAKKKREAEERRKEAREA